MQTIAVSEEVRFIREGDSLYLSCRDVAAELRFEFKLVNPNLATFCRTGDSEFCLPLRLTSLNHRGADGDLFVTADTLSKALRFSIDDRRSAIAIRPGEDSNNLRNHSDTIGYNSEWQKGRGFRTGETVPDIPLVDLDGNEVRFSKFLGKRYLLYCWASW